MNTAIGKAAESYIYNLILKSDKNNPAWNSENKLFSKQNKWNYIDACIIKALSGYYEIENNEAVFDYIKDFMDSYINEDYSIKTLNPKEFNCDNYNGGKNLLFLYRKTSDEKYIKAADYLISLINNHPRLKIGNLWHKTIYPDQIWLDGTYMMLPFMAEYANIKNIPDIYADIRNQLENIRNIMKDDKTGLYYHGYDESRKSLWCNEESGLSSEFWLRSNCWLCTALVDLYELVKEKNLSDFISDMLTELLRALYSFQQDNNMLRQLPLCDNVRNYDETSGTALYSYSAIKASNMNITDEFLNSGINALESIADNYISEIENEIPVLKNICLVAGLGGENNRNGSAEYYLSEPVVKNDAKGIAPFIMAYTEYRKSKSR